MVWPDIWYNPPDTSPVPGPMVLPSDEVMECVLKMAPFEECFDFECLSEAPINWLEHQAKTAAIKLMVQGAQQWMGAILSQCGCMRRCVLVTR
eukprot:6462957-Amphidinium_carterae.5